MSSFPKSTFLQLISLTLLLHSQTPAFSKTPNSHLLLGTLPSPISGAAAFLHPIAVTFSATSSFSLIKNSNQDPNFSNNNTISFFLLPNNSTHAIKDNSIFLLQLPISKHHKDSNFTLTAATITIHHKKGGILTTVSMGEKNHIFFTNNFTKHIIYAGFLSSNNNNSESLVIKSYPLSSRRITLQSKNPLKRHHQIINLDILLRAAILSSSAAIIILTGVNIKEQFTHESLKNNKEKQSLLKNFRKFNHREIKSGTNNFSDMIGRGGSARVYKMNYPPSSSSSFLAVKRFSKDKASKQSYLNELNAITQLQHSNILKLQGWFDMSSGEYLLLYDYMPNNSLHHVLHTPKDQILPWPHRHNIAIKLAKVIKHLHLECSPPLVHGDIKARNIMITGDFQPMLADFGLSRICGEQTSGKPKFDEKRDVYSYGVVLIELCTGMTETNMAEGYVENVREMERDDQLMEAADERLGDSFKPDEMSMLLKLGLICACEDKEKRPEIGWVLDVLNGEEAI